MNAIQQISFHTYPNTWTKTQLHRYIRRNISSKLSTGIMVHKWHHEIDLINILPHLVQLGPTNRIDEKYSLKIPTRSQTHKALELLLLVCNIRGKAPLHEFQAADLYLQFKCSEFDGIFHIIESIRLQLACRCRAYEQCRRTKCVLHCSCMVRYGLCMPREFFISTLMSSHDCVDPSTFFTRRIIYPCHCVLYWLQISPTWSSFRWLFRFVGLCFTCLFDCPRDMTQLARSDNDNGIKTIIPECFGCLNECEIYSNNNNNTQSSAYKWKNPSCD